MFEWKVNQIRVGMMERVLNHMEKQGYEVQVIIPIAGDSEDGGPHKEVLLAGKKDTAVTAVQSHNGMPSITPENLDIVYGRQRDSPSP